MLCLPRSKRWEFRGGHASYSPHRNISTMIYWVGQKVLFSFVFFFIGGSSSALLSLNSLETILLDCIVTAVISGLHLKNLSTLVNFCVAILILKMKENMQHCWCIMLYYFKKGKNATDIQKQLVYAEGAVIDWMCQKWFVKFLGTIDMWPNNSLLWAVWCIGRCLAAPLASTH